MKKIRITLMSIAIIGAICSAFTTRTTKVVCEDCTQYYKSGDNYYPAGIFGEGYDCEWDVNQANTCSYYKPDPAGQPNYYAPCRFGVYTPVGININDNKLKK